jgi:tetratricopeptide (TPR) repeat protein
MSAPIDRLEEATRLLRAERERGESSSADRTLTRVLLALREEKRRRGRALVLFWPIAAVLAASAAYAASSRSLPELLAAVGLGESADEAREANEAREVPDARIGRTPPIARPTSPPVAALPDVERPDLREPEPRPRPGAASNGHAARPERAKAMRTEADSTRTARAADEPFEALYRRAHEAHFTQRDFVHALASWDEYLAADPVGRFALEARYNRAIALAHLGRRDEARVALAPFADGSLGSYRRADAQRLLVALAPPP